MIHLFSALEVVLTQIHFRALQLGLLHTYDLTNGKEFTIKINGICEYINFGWGDKVNTPSTIIFKLTNGQSKSVYNIKHIITQINSFGSIDIWNFYYFFAYLPNLTTLPKAADGNCYLPKPMQSVLQNKNDKSTFNYYNIFRGDTNLSYDSISSIVFPGAYNKNENNEYIETVSSIDPTTLHSYDIAYAFVACDNITEIPTNLTNFISSLNYANWHNESGYILSSANFKFSYDGLVNTTSPNWTLDARKKYGNDFDSWNFSYGGLLSTSQEIQKNENGEQIIKTISTFTGANYKLLDDNRKSNKFACKIYISRWVFVVFLLSALYY